MTTRTSSKTASSVDFNSSWDHLLNSGKQLLALAAGDQWPQARRLRTERLAFSRRHFERYPVGPKNRQHYQHRLAELFEMEMNIDERFARQDRPGQRNNHLRLVK